MVKFIKNWYIKWNKEGLEKARQEYYAFADLQRKAREFQDFQLEQREREVRALETIAKNLEKY